VTTTTSRRPTSARSGTAGPDRTRRTLLVAVAASAAAIAALFGIYVSAAPSQGELPTPGKVSYITAEPASGSAPQMRLPSADGSAFDLADLRGQSVLLYFQEGLMCQACWTQLRDLENAEAELKAAGVDTIVNVTTDPADLLARKIKDENFSTTTVSDPTGEVSAEFGALGVGMMGDSMNGHSFVLIGPDGDIQWRADYGGAPDYTMYVPVPQLLADMSTRTTA
jgi:peroxiredoxin